MVADERMIKCLQNEYSRGYKILYSLAIVLYAPLGVYTSGISSFLLADFLLYGVTLILFFAIYKKNGTVNPQYVLFIPISYIVLITIFFALNDISIILRTCRFVYYLLFVTIFVRQFFSVKITMSIYKYVVVFATLFLIVQYICYTYGGYYLPGYLPFLNIAREDLVLYSADIYTAVNQRMRSIFSEPAQYAAYSAFFLYLLLIKNGLNELNKNNFLVSIFVTIGIILSSSATGVILAILGWLIFVVLKTLKGRFTLKYLIFFPFFLFALFYVFQLDAVQHSFFRLTTNSSEEVRLVSFFEVLDFSSFSASLLFGHAMDLQEIYLASFGRMIFYFGILGTICFVGVCFFNSIKNIYAFLIFCFIFVMGIGTSLWISGSFMLYLSFLLFYSLSSSLPRGYIDGEN